MKSKKQRQKIYLAAAEKIEIEECVFMCDAINESDHKINSRGIDTDRIFKSYLELSRFKPKYSIDKSVGFFGISNDPTFSFQPLSCRQKTRILILLFCAEMCN